MATVGVVCLLVVVLAGVAQTRMTDLDAKAASLYDDSLVTERVVHDVETTLLDARLNDAYANILLLLSLDATEAQELAASGFDRLGELLPELQALPLDDHAAAAAAELEAAYGDFRTAWAELLEVAAVDLNGILAHFEEVVTPTIERMSGAVDELLADSAEHAAESRAAAESAHESGRTVIYVVAAFAVLVGFGLAWIVSRLMGRSARRAVEVLEAVAAGDLTHRADVAGRDEMAALAAAVNATVDRTAEALRAIEANAGTLASSSTELSAVARQVGASAEHTTAQSSSAASVAEQVSANVGTVASAAAQMGASIREIAGSATEAVKVADNAVAVARSTTETVTKLSESSAEIGEVIKVITSIAEQTNLLALNATIEAARAGEAGKGFAVVANEVKELAKQTSEATDDIATKVTAIQSDATAVSEAIARITEVIGQINEIQSTIAAAVEEQSVTTSEIARSVDEAAVGTTDIAANVAGVAQATHDTSSGAAGTLQAAEDLGRMAEELRELVGRFVLDRRDGEPVLVDA